ncbi:MAG TPA: thiamine pyrophosphate-binding protein [Dehalococcoidia bacterium]|nr:thiamine pyrophosphate-binding protein [Dehalococcoidia bacterium]
MAWVDGGDMIARVMKQEGTKVLFTLSGGHIQNIYDGCIDEDIRVIDTRHEQSAAHAADGYARANRTVGVAAVTAGPGVTDALTGVANAYRAGSPMILIGGAAPLRTAGRGALQEMEQVEIFRPVTKWATSIQTTERIAETLSDAYRVALSGRPGPVYVEVPSDILFGRVEEEDFTLPTKYRHEVRSPADAGALQRAVEAIKGSKRLAMMAGTPIFWSGADKELQEFVELIGTPIYTNEMARGAIPWEHPQKGNWARRTALAGADVIIVFGSPIDFRLRFGQAPLFNPDATVIVYDYDEETIGKNRPVDIGLTGDAKTVLQQLTDAIGSPLDRDEEWLTELRDEEQRGRELRQPLLESDETPIHPLRLCAEIAKFVDDNTIIVGDGGDIVATSSKYLPINHLGQWFDPGPLGTLGVGTGFCMAIKASHPEKRILMVNGDGAFGLNGFDFDTLVRHDLPIVSVVGNDRQWGQIIVGQVRQYGEERAIATRLDNNARYDRVVEALGGYGEYVTEPEEIGPAIQRAFDSGLPACVNVIMDQRPPGVEGGYSFT